MLTRTEELAQKWWAIWIAFFVCTALLATVVQLIIMPYVLPSMHYGHGLFVPDSTGFHQIAQDQAKAMMNSGWKVWKLKPKNFYPAGIASLFYYLWCPEPFAVIPFNAALHATSGCIIVFLLSFFVKGRITALGGAALFVLNPASLEWTSQIHRDGTFILGNLLILSAWLLLFQAAEDGKWRNNLYSFLAALSGTLCIWVSRPYWIQVVEVACVFMIAAMIVLLAMAWFNKSLFRYRLIATVIMGVLMLGMQVLFVDKSTSFTEKFETEEARGERIELRVTKKDAIVTIGEFKGRFIPGGAPSGLSGNEKMSEEPLPARVIGEGPRILITHGKFTGITMPLTIVWNFSPLIPDFIESKLYGMAVYRLSSTLSGGKSLIDPEIQFNSFLSYLYYLPRAVQIGFLSPFPSLWFEPGRTVGTSIGRIILGIVTVFFYICLVFFVWGLSTCGKNYLRWIIISYCTYGLLVFTYAYPNVGTFLRLRYGFYMTIVSIGFAFAIQLFLAQGKCNDILSKGAK